MAESHAKSGSPAPPLRVCLVISAFRSDDAVLEILSSLKDRGESLFFQTIVVDSLGSGRIPAEIEARGLATVRYVGFDRNLGSAGNLAERLRLAAETGADFAYAINHDGIVDPDVVGKLIVAARAHERIGAVYPLRRMIAHEGRYDLTGKSALPLPFFGVSEPPREPYTEVYWSSSNGALYNLTPVREGLLPWDDLWMGWEDMGYGWLLHSKGYKQLVVSDAIVDDNYEFRRRGGVKVSDKPAWYAYYHARNLILVARRNEQPLPFQALVGARVLLEYGLTTALRPQKMLRYRLLTRGLIDGLRGKSGKWRLP